jgi:hypothetical protein
MKFGWDVYDDIFDFLLDYNTDVRDDRQHNVYVLL